MQIDANNRGYIILVNEVGPLMEEVPPIFSSCANVFVPGHDEKYANCNITNGHTPCELLKEMHRAKEFRTYFLAILPIVLSVIAFILNATYLAITIRIFMRESSSYRKRYVFLMSRTLSTLMALILFYVVVICWKTSGFQYSSAMIFLLIGGLNFLSITGTYLALTCLLYTAVVHPFFYKTKLTLRHCYIIVALIWLFSMIVSICVGLWGATLFYPESAPVRCSFSHCQKPLAIMIVICLSICYSAVLGLYAVLLIRLHRIDRARSASTPVTTGSTMDRHRANVAAMNRLAFNMATFAIGSIPILIVSIVALANLRDLSSLGEGEKTPCKTYLNSYLFVEVEILASIAGIVWELAMILDPIINTVVDQKMLSAVKNGISIAKESIKSLRRHPSQVNTSITEVHNERI